MPTPAELGYGNAMQQQWAGAGINDLPDYMKMFSGEQRDLSDLVRVYQMLTNPNLNMGEFTSTGKAEGILQNMGWGIGPDGKPVWNGQQGGAWQAGQGGDEGYWQNAYPDYNPTGTWGQSDQDYFNQAYLQRKTNPNMGAWAETVKPALTGIAAVLAPILGLAGAGAFSAAPVAEGGMMAGSGTGLETIGSAPGLGNASGGIAGGIGPTSSTAGGGGGMGLWDSIFGGGGIGNAAGLSGPESTVIAGGGSGGGGGGLWGSISGLLGGGGSGGSGAGIWDSISGLLGGGGAAPTGGNSFTNGGLASIIQGLLGIGGSYMGGEATKDAANKANDTLWNMYDQSRKDTEGQRALFDLIAPQLKQQAMSPNYPAIPTLQNQVNVDYANDPIFQQQKSEIMNTLNRRMASQGRFNSSAADDSINRNLSPLMQDSYSRNLDTLNRTNQNALTSYGLGYDQNKNLYGRSLDLAKIGAGAAASAGQGAMSTGNALAGVDMANGGNQATMWGGMAGAGMGGINNYLLYNLLSQRRAA